MPDLKTKISQLNAWTPVDTDIIPFVNLQGTPVTQKATRGDLKWADGNGISSIVLTGTVWLVKTYRITFTDATFFDYDVTDWADGADGANWADGTDWRSIVSIARTTWDGSPWTTDTYTITYDIAPLTSTFDVYNGADWVGGVTDWDKWDVTVSGSGSTWTIDNNAVDFAKMQDISQNHFIGRHTAGSGDPQMLSATQARSILNVEDGADVTDTANVTAAWALMDSEVTNLAQVKAFDSSDYATAAQWALADSSLQSSDIWTSVQAYDADTAKLDVAQEYTKQQNFNATTLTDAASIAWNLDDNQVTSVTLAWNRTLAAPTNMVDGWTYILRVIQDGTGTRTLAYNPVFKFPWGTAPTLSTASGSIDILTFISDWTNMYWVAQLDFS